MTVAVTKIVHAKIALLANGAYVDTGPGTGSEERNVRAALIGLGDAVHTFGNVSAGGLRNALAGNDVLYIPELEIGALNPSAGAAAAIRNFVGHGHTLVINADDSNHS